MRGLYEGYFFYVYLTLWVFQVLFFSGELCYIVVTLDWTAQVSIQ